MLLRKCIRSVNNRSCLFNRLLSTDKTTDGTPSTPPLSAPGQPIATALSDQRKEGKFVKSSKSLESVYRCDDVIKNQEMLSNLSSLHSLVLSHHKALSKQTHRDRPITRNDFFNVKSLFTLRDLFESRVHLGHHIGCWNSANSKYLYGIRNNMHVIDIASTEQHLWRALDVLSHVAYSGGSVLFVNNRAGYGHIVQEAAASCTEGQWTDAGELGTFEQPDFSWFDKNKPDLVICSSVNNPLSQKLLLHANKHLVPSIGILDSDVDPTNLTYVIPGNDDSSQSILLYHRLFAKAVQRAKLVKDTLQNLDSTSRVKQAR
ncbi:hypothetical protein ACHWQZ_G002817 [Mnemiopsis leidyi]